MRAVLVGLGIVAALWLLAVLALLWVGRRTLARELVSLIPNLILLFRDLLRDDRVPIGSKALLVLGAAWLASPIDLVPEFLPVVGPLDDAIVAGLVVRHLVRRAGPDLLREHWRGSPRTLEVILRAVRVARPIA